jgi:hypothetical protein
MPQERLFNRHRKPPQKTRFKFRNVSRDIRELDSALSSSRKPVQMKFGRRNLAVKNMDELITAMRASYTEDRVGIEMPLKIERQIKNYVFGNGLEKDFNIGVSKQLATRYQHIETRVSKAAAAAMSDRLAQLTDQLQDRANQMAGSAATGFLDLALLAVATLGVIYIVNEQPSNVDEQWEDYESKSQEFKDRSNNFKDGVSTIMESLNKDEKDDEEDDNKTDSGSIVEPGWPWIGMDKAPRFQLQVVNDLLNFANDVKSLELFMVNHYA